MTLQALLDSKNITKYHLSKVSGVPKTTVIDICSGKSSIENCTAKTVQQISEALGCTMEEIMTLENPNCYDKETGLPTDDSYLECGLPQYLQDLLEKMKKSWAIIDRGEKDYCWDIYWCELNADINSAEVDNVISAKQAWHLRRKYLRMEANEKA